MSRLFKTEKHAEEYAQISKNNIKTLTKNRASNSFMFIAVGKQAKQLFNSAFF